MRPHVWVPGRGSHQKGLCAELVQFGLRQSDGVHVEFDLPAAPRDGVAESGKVFEEAHGGLSEATEMAGGPLSTTR